MRHFLLGSGFLSLCLLAGPVLASSTWQVVHQETDGAITNVVALDDQVAFAAALQQPPGQDNPSPAWMRTENGADWNVLPAQGHTPGAILMLTDLACATKLQCYAMANSIDGGTMDMKMGAFIKSADGGKTWVFPVASPLGALTPSRMAVVSEKDVWLFGALQVAHTTNGGLTFAKMTPKVGDTWFQATLDGSFVNAQEGWVTNGKSTTDQSGKNETIEAKGGLLKTTDGGATWTVLFEGRTEMPKRIKMVDAQTGFLWGYDAAGPFLRRTDDGGTTWTPMAIPAATGGTVNSVDDVWVFNGNALMVVASGSIGEEASFHAIYKVSDGHTLVEEDTGVDGRMNAMLSIACPSQRLCWLGGVKVTLLKYTSDAAIPGDDTGPATGDNAGGPDAGVGPETVGGDLAGGSCTPGIHACDGNRRMVCDADGTTWAFVESCPVSGKVCKAGECVEGEDSGSGGCSAGAPATGAWLALLLAGLVLAPRRRRA